MSKCKALPDQARLRELFDYDPDTGWLTWKCNRGWRMIAGQRAGSGRARRRVKIDGTFYREHRLIWMWWHGEDPGELVIDHLNNDPSDNRINNLRVATVTQNAYNYASKKRPYRGVEVRQSQRGERYYVGIKHQGKQIILGTYATLEEAIEARQSAELQYWGELSDSTVK